MVFLIGIGIAIYGALWLTGGTAWTVVIIGCAIGAFGFVSGK